MSATLGLLVAARLRSVENFAGIINVVLFPLLFLSGALYPTGGHAAALPAWLARINPVTYAVDLMRHALGQPAEVLGRSRAVAASAVVGSHGARVPRSLLLAASTEQRVHRFGEPATSSRARLGLPDR